MVYGERAIANALGFANPQRGIQQRRQYSQYDRPQVSRRPFMPIDPYNDDTVMMPHGSDGLPLDMLERAEQFDRAQRRRIGIPHDTDDWSDSRVRAYRDKYAPNIKAYLASQPSHQIRNQNLQSMPIERLRNLIWGFRNCPPPGQHYGPGQHNEIGHHRGPGQHNEPGQHYGVGQHHGPGQHYGPGFDPNPASNQVCGYPPIPPNNQFLPPGGIPQICRPCRSDNGRIPQMKPERPSRPSSPPGRIPKEPTLSIYSDYTQSTPHTSHSSRSSDEERDDEDEDETIHGIDHDHGQAYGLDGGHGRAYGIDDDHEPTYGLDDEYGRDHALDGIPWDDGNPDWVSSVWSERSHTPSSSLRHHEGRIPLARVPRSVSDENIARSVTTYRRPFVEDGNSTIASSRSRHSHHGW